MIAASIAFALSRCAFAAANDNSAFYIAAIIGGFFLQIFEVLSD